MFDLGGKVMNQSAGRPSAEELLKDPALRDICRWRLPDSGTENVPADNVTFAKEHGEGFFRAAEGATKLLE
jgi:hypothetical protein